MSTLPVVSGRTCARALQAFGFEVERQRGSHLILVRREPYAMVVVPDHKVLDRGTLRGILRQAAVSVEKFLEVL